MSNDNHDDTFYSELGLHISPKCIHTPTGAIIHFAQGSILNFQGHCIVNAANELGIGGGGVDGAINRASGPQLVKARMNLPMESPGVRIPAGEVRVTPAFGGELHCWRIIHAVSANYNQVNQEDGDNLVRNAYSNALSVANRMECPRIAFSLLSAGIYRGNCTLEHVLSLAVETLVECATKGQIIYLVAFTEQEVEALRIVFQQQLIHLVVQAIRVRDKVYLQNHFFTDIIQEMWKVPCQSLLWRSYERFMPAYGFTCCEDLHKHVEENSTQTCEFLGIRRTEYVHRKKNGTLVQSVNDQLDRLVF